MSPLLKEFFSGFPLLQALQLASTLAVGYLFFQSRILSDLYKNDPIAIKAVSKRLVCVLFLSVFLWLSLLSFGLFELFKGIVLFLISVVCIGAISLRTCLSWGILLKVIRQEENYLKKIRHVYMRKVIRQEKNYLKKIRHGYMRKAKTEDMKTEDWKHIIAALDNSTNADLFRYFKNDLGTLLKDENIAGDLLPVFYDNKEKIPDSLAGLTYKLIDNASPAEYRNDLKRYLKEKTMKRIEKFLDQIAHFSKCVTEEEIKSFLMIMRTQISLTSPIIQ